MPMHAASANNDKNVEQLLYDLTQSKLNGVAVVLDQLADIDGDTMLPLFENLLEGHLYYKKDNHTLLIIDKKSDNSLHAQALFTDKDLGVVKKKTIKKIRVNNKLRSHIRRLIALKKINSNNYSLRLSAVDTMFGKVDKDSAKIFSDRLGVENNKDVKVAIKELLALHQLTSSSIPEERLSALAVLNNSLKPMVMNEISTLQEKNSAGEYIEPSQAVRDAANKAVQRIEQKIKYYRFLEQLFFGLSLGSVLLLAAIGLSITFGVMGVINMAHGEMIMLGAYTTYVVQLLMPNAIEYSLWVAIPAAFLVSGAMGVAIERGVIRFLKGRPLETLLATFGVSLILQQLVRSIFSPLNRQVISPEWMSGSLEFNAIFSITYNRLYILLFSLLVFFILHLILKKTSLGLNVRAVSQNRNMAKAMGIKTDRVDAMTFGLGSGIAGVAGVALSQLTNVGPNLGQSYIIDSFMVVVFGGVGNLLGTLVGSFSLGIANKFLEPATGAVLANIIILIFIILFIQRRPKGLFPQKGRTAND